MSEAEQVLTIDVVSDVVCPWCYLGEKRLEEALSEDAGPVVVRWRPYQLDPTIPEAGSIAPSTWRKSSARAAGSSRRTRISRAWAPRLASPSPSTRSSARPTRSTPTGSSAGRRRPAFRPKSPIDCSRPISSRDATSATASVLIEIAGECGLDAGEVETLLAGDADIDLVRQEIEQAQSMGVSGVPFFIFGGRVGVPGAQEPSVLRQAIAQARQEMADAANGAAASA